MIMNPFEQNEQLLHFLTSQVEREVIDYIRQEIEHDAPDSVPTADELFTFFQSPDKPTGLDACQQKQEHAKHPSNPWMFPSGRTGELSHPDSVVTLHKRILKDAGLEHIRFHDLRHTFATLALQNGVDVKTVSSMLGHYDAGFTLRTYTHATRQKQDEAAQTMGNFMAQVM